MLTNDSDAVLLEAIQAGNLELAQKCLDEGADINVSDNDGNSILSLAIKNNALDLALNLLNLKANVTTKACKELLEKMSSDISSTTTDELTVEDVTFAFIKHCPDETLKDELFRKFIQREINLKYNVLEAIKYFLSNKIILNINIDVFNDVLNAGITDVIQLLRAVGSALDQKELSKFFEQLTESEKNIICLKAGDDLVEVISSDFDLIDSLMSQYLGYPSICEAYERLQTFNPLITRITERMKDESYRNEIYRRKDQRQLEELKLQKQVLLDQYKMNQFCRPALISLSSKIHNLEAAMIIDQIVLASNDGRQSIDTLAEQLKNFDSSNMMELYHKLDQSKQTKAIAKQVKDLMNKRYHTLVDLKSACQYVYDNHYSKAYTDTSILFDWDLHTPHGTIQRPNHGLAHVMRTAWMVPVVAEYLKNSSFEDSTFQFTDDEIKKLQIVVLFWVAGRDNDVGSMHNKALFTQFREQSVRNFETYIRTEAPDLMTQSEIEKYKDLLLNKNEYADNPENILLNIIHDLDVIRCLDISSFDMYVRPKIEKFIDKPKLQQLVNYTSGLISATGDRNITNNTTYHNDIFFKTSTSVDACLERISLVAPPHDSDLNMLFEGGVTMKSQFRKQMGVAIKPELPLMLSPLPKNIYTKQFEYIIKKTLESLSQGNQIQLEYDHQRNIIIDVEGFRYNVTEILKYANISHLTFSTKDYERFQQYIDKSTDVLFQPHFPNDLNGLDGKIDKNKLHDKYPDSSLNNLPMGALYAINIYTGKAYEKINPLLRTGSQADKTVTVTTLLTSAILASALPKVAEKEMVPTYRCIGAAVDLEETKARLTQTAKTAFDPAFYSTSRDKPDMSFIVHNAKNFIYAEVRGAYVDPISQVQGENEILIAPEQWQWTHFQSDSKGNFYFINRQVAALDDLTAQQLEFVPQLGFVDQYGNTGLMYSVLYYLPGITDHLTPQSVNKQNMHGRTALHFVGLYQDILNNSDEKNQDVKEHIEAMIEGFLENGANLAIKDNTGMTPYQVLSHMSLSDVLRQKIEIHYQKDILEGLIVGIREGTGNAKAQDQFVYFKNSAFELIANEHHLRTTVALEILKRLVFKYPTLQFVELRNEFHNAINDNQIWQILIDEHYPYLKSKHQNEYLHRPRQLFERQYNFSSPVPDNILQPFMLLSLQGKLDEIEASDLHPSHKIRLFTISLANGHQKALEKIDSEKLDGAFIYAAYLGNPEVVEFFLNRFNISTLNKEAALVAAAKNNHLDIFTLIACQDDIELKNIQLTFNTVLTSSIPLSDSISHANLDIITKSTIPDENKQWLYSLAAAIGNSQALENLDVMGKENALQLAAQMGHVKVVKSLLKTICFSPEAKAKAISFANDRGYTDIVNLLSKRRKQESRAKPLRMSTGSPESTKNEPAVVVSNKEPTKEEVERLKNLIKGG